MNRTNEYWLHLVMEYTDAALIPQDAGMGQDAIPVRDAALLAKQGWIRKNNHKRWVVTQAGRKELK